MGHLVLDYSPAKVSHVPLRQLNFRPVSDPQKWRTDSVDQTMCKALQNNAVDLVIRVGRCVVLLLSLSSKASTSGD